MLCLQLFNGADSCSPSLDRPFSESLNINKPSGVHTAEQLKHGVGGMLAGIHTQTQRKGSSSVQGCLLSLRQIFVCICDLPAFPSWG